MEKWIKEKISQMTLDEKIGMVHGNALFKNAGVERIGIERLVMSDGPCGVRFDHKDDEWIPVNEEMCYVSWIPSGAALAATWNVKAAESIGEVLGDEACGRGKQVILAPGINIQRTPLCGRNFEYMSEDPYLTGKLAAAEIRGVQSKDVAVCVKHYALNNQEKERMSVDVQIDERTLRELYLPAFEMAVKEGDAYSVMCSYNKVNGLYASENPTLLTDILKNEWEYDGVVISDWGAVHSTVESALAGMDLEMGVTYNFDEYYFAKSLKEAVENGQVPEEVLDDKVARILRLQKKIKIYDGVRNKGCYNSIAHHEAILNAAREAVVLLKNEDNILPINTDDIKTIAVIGDAAARRTALGGGSSEVKALYEITPLLGINMVSGGNVKVKYAKGYYVDNENHVAGEVDWQATSLDAQVDTRDSEGSVDETALKRKEYLEQAIELAKECDVVIYVGGLNRAYDTEGFDKTSYDLPYNQAEVINALLEVRPDMIVSILSGSAVNMTPFADKAKAILWNSMNGMSGGLALAEVLFGQVNPSGKLPVSFPYKLEDCPAHSIGEYPGTYDEKGAITCKYSEGIYVGYRHYVTNNVPVLYPFGHGLSYTEYEYGDIKVEYEADSVSVSCRVTNTGELEGKETVQLYVSQIRPQVDRPKRELKGFDKIHLKSGETKNVKFVLDKKSFSYYSVESHNYNTDNGEYIIEIGSSVEDIRLSEGISLKFNS